MSKADKTRQFIIERTAPIFNTKGYAVTSISDITDATGLTKGSIYGNFSSKDEVVIEAYKYNVGKLSLAMDHAILQTADPYTQLLAMVDFYRNVFERIMQQGGCPMLNAATESDDYLLFLKETVKRSFITWHEKVTKVIQQGIDIGSFKEDIEVSLYASTFMMLIEGGILLARTLDQHEQLAIALDRVLKIIKDEIVK